MNFTNVLSKKLSAAFVAIACLFSANAAFSNEAYLGVAGFITNVDLGPGGVPTVTFDDYDDDGREVKGFQIRSVEYDSPADFAGLRRGDVLIEAEGIALTSYSRLSRMRRALAHEGSIEVFFVRNGRMRSTIVGGEGGGGGGGGVPTVITSDR